MENIKMSARDKRDFLADMLADALNLPDEVKKNLIEMACIQTEIVERIKHDKALNQKTVSRYNELCYKHFSMMQDGEEFTKEEPEPETAKPITVKKAPQPETGTWGDWKVEDIVRNYIIDHLDKSDPEKPDFDVYIVWKCKTLQNWKYLLASTLPDGMYYEMTFNGDKIEWYLDAYRKVENKVIPGAKK